MTTCDAAAAGIPAAVVAGRVRVELVGVDETGVEEVVSDEDPVLVMSTLVAVTAPPTGLKAMLRVVLDAGRVVVKPTVVSLPSAPTIVNSGEILPLDPWSERT